MFGYRSNKHFLGDSSVPPLPTRINSHSHALLLYRTMRELSPKDAWRSSATNPYRRAKPTPHASFGMTNSIAAVSPAAFASLFVPRSTMLGSSSAFSSLRCFSQVQNCISKLTHRIAAITTKSTSKMSTSSISPVRIESLSTTSTFQKEAITYSRYSQI